MLSQVKQTLHKTHFTMIPELHSSVQYIMIMNFHNIIIMDASKYCKQVSYIPSFLFKAINHVIKRTTWMFFNLDL